MSQLSKLSRDTSSFATDVSPAITIRPSKSFDARHVYNSCKVYRLFTEYKQCDVSGKKVAETPIAVISTASEVACLSGLYATFSMTIPRSVQAITARTMESQEFSPHVVMQGEYNISAHHNNIAVCEVKHFGNTVYKRIAQSYNCVYTAEAYSVDEVIKKTHIQTFLPFGIDKTQDVITYITSVLVINTIYNKL